MEDTEGMTARKRTSETVTSPSVESDNVITTKSMKSKPEPKSKVTPKPEPEVVAVYAEGPLWHSGTGRLEKGYSVIPKETAEKWLAISERVRLATPQEVASAFGV